MFCSPAPGVVCRGECINPNAELFGQRPRFPIRSDTGGGSIIAYRHDPESSAGQRFDDILRNLFGFLRVYSTLWVILARVANRSRDYRIHLMRIGHMSLQVLKSVPVAVTPLLGTKRLAVHLGIRSTMRLFPESPTSANRLMVLTFEK
jgi:hypothetical protein